MPGFFSFFTRSSKPIRRPASCRKTLALEQLETRLAPAVNVLTFHNDIQSTGANLAEDQLTPANVQVNTFGKLTTTPLDGYVYSEPLVVTNATISNGINSAIATNPAGTYATVVYATTSNASVYAIDGKAGSGTILWQRSFLNTTNAGGNVNNTLGATSITPVTNKDVNVTEMDPLFGIIGTPVIDAATNTLYVVAKTKEVVGSTAHFVQRLHALNLADGTDKVAPYLIGDTSGSNTNNTQIYVYGSTDGAVTDPYNATGQPVVQFNALAQNQRGGLSLVNNTLYVIWGSHAGQNLPHHGWVAAWNVSNLSTNGFQLKGVLNSTPNGVMGGIWDGAGKLAFEADGSAFYFETGNGPKTHTNPALDANGFPADGNYLNAVIKVVADAGTSAANQSKNGWGFRIADYFIPYNQVALDNVGHDLGSAAPVVLPDSAGLPGHPHLMVVSGKEGKIYLVDRDNMGKFDPNGDHVVNSVANGDGTGHNTPIVQLSAALSTAAFFNGKVYYSSGYVGNAYSYAIQADGTLLTTSQSAAMLGWLPGSVVISANQNSNGIAWVMDRNNMLIHAYDANSFATELWNSGLRAGGADSVGDVMKFAAPTVANGLVYVGTTSGLVTYGLLPQAKSAPLAPILSATVLSGSAITLSWADGTATVNSATSYVVEESASGGNFAAVTTAPAGATSVVVNGLSALTAYSFRIRGCNSSGNGNYSNTASATTTNQGGGALDFSGGFAGSTSKLTYNGVAAIAGSRLELTNGGDTTAGSVFSNSPVDVTKFTTQFSFQLPSSDADGFTFTIQGNGPTALGYTGGSLGYGPNPTTSSGGIAKSVAVKFDLFDNLGEGDNSTGLYTNGANPRNAGSINLTPSGVDFHSGHLFQVNMSYDGTTLSVAIKDAQTGVTTTQNYTVDITGAVQSGTAYVGFTGATGGLTSIQDITAWTFSPTTAAPQTVNIPSGLAATPTNATAVRLTWTNNAANPTGFKLDRATNSSFTQNLVTQLLPAAPVSFTDTAAGLAAGSSYFYRIRAVNAGGESALSNVASVSIPLAPPAPSNALVTSVSTTEIDLSWTDNAGSAATTYVILRAKNGVSFVDYVHLPGLPGTAPGTYTWADTGLTPGSSYAYRVAAVNSSGYHSFASVNAATITTPPTWLTATGGSSLVNLSWSAPAPGPLKYNIYRGTTPGGESASPLAAGVTKTVYVDTSVAAGVTYYYKVTAVNANNSQVPPLPAESAPSNEATTLDQAAFVKGLYHKVLNRDSDPTGLAAWVNILSVGATRNSVARAFWDSAEHRGLEVDSYYLTYLHRPADPMGRASWVNALLAGVGEEAVQLSFLSSAEYLAIHSGNDAYVTALYLDLLNRPADAGGKAFWVSSLQNGLPAQEVAKAILTSTESHSRTINGFYASFLERLVDSLGLQYWLNTLTGGTVLEDIAVSVLGSDEFYIVSKKSPGL